MRLVPEVGDRVVIQGDCIGGYNKNGGTLLFKEGTRWKVEVVKAWHDYECGWRYWGRFILPKQLEAAIQQGAAGRPARKGDEYLPDQEALGPEICFFSEFDVIDTFSR